MTSVVLKQIPNALTTLRLVLAAPICFFILKEDYHMALGITFIAGISDAIDGWLARKWDCLSRYGSIVDPISDKALLIGSYLCFAIVELLPWSVAAIVVGRDILIMSGAIAYKAFFGPYKMAPSVLGKTSTCIQIVFALTLLAHQVFPTLPEPAFTIGSGLVVSITFLSGVHYGWSWGRKAIQAARAKRG